MYFAKVTTILIALLIYEVHQPAQAKSDMDFVFDHADCHVLGKSGIAKQFNCSLSKNAKRRTFNFEVMYTQPIKQFFMNFLMTMPRKGVADFVLLNATNANGCQFLSNRNQVTLLQLTRDNLERYSNMPKKCPFPKDTLFFIRGYRAAMDMLPAFSFEAPLNIKFEMVVDRQPVGVGYIQSHFAKKNKKGSNF